MISSYNSRINVCRPLAKPAAIIVAACLLLLAASAPCHAECSACEGTSGYKGAAEQHAAFLKTLGPEQEQFPDGLNGPQRSRLSRNSSNSSDGIDQIKNASSINGGSTDNDTTGVGSTGSQSSRYLIKPKDVRRTDIIIDAGDESPAYIDGAISIPYSSLLNKDKVLMQPEEIAAILGHSGISPQFRVIVYGTGCGSCGIGPSAATFVFFALRYAGHDNVLLLDGNISDWQKAGFAVSDKPSVLQPLSFDSASNASLMAQYGDVANGNLNVIDSRPSQDYLTGSIPNAINLPFERFIDNGSIKEKKDLWTELGVADRKKPIAVYSSSMVKSSLVWYVFYREGYDARLYSLSDYLINKQAEATASAFGEVGADVLANAEVVGSANSKLNIDLDKNLTRALPNPSAPGEIKIYAGFKESQPNDDRVTASNNSTSGSSTIGSPSNDSTSSNPSSGGKSNSTNATGDFAKLVPATTNDDANIKLHTMGCATCEPITLLAGGSLNKNRREGVALGANKVESVAPGTAFVCKATIRNMEGSIVSVVPMKQAAQDIYSGSWDATTAGAGTYNVTITATVADAKKEFKDAISITILPGGRDLSRFKRLG